LAFTHIATNFDILCNGQEQRSLNLACACSGKEEQRAQNCASTLCRRVFHQKEETMPHKPKFDFLSNLIGILDIMLNDIHEGKWNGLGGKFELGESPEECQSWRCSRWLVSRSDSPKVYNGHCFAVTDDPLAVLAELLGN
jgi:hypothetical protein